MVLYNGLLSTNYRNAFILNSFFAAFVAVVAVNSNTFFNKLFQDLASKTKQVVTSIKKNIKETVDKQDNPPYPIPTTPHPSHTPHNHHTYEPYESLTPTPSQRQDPHHTPYHTPPHTQHPHSTPHIYPHQSKIHKWLKKHLPFLSNIKYHTVMSTITTFLFTYLIAFIVYIIMYVTVGFGGGMITGCDKFSCTWSGKGTIGEKYTV